MAKKSKNQSGNMPANLSQAAVSLGVFRAEQLLAPMASPFASWFEAKGGTSENAIAVLKAVAPMLADLSEVSGNAGITEFVADDVEHVVDAMVETMLETNGEEEVIELIIEAFHLYIDFLIETELWSGTEKDYEEVHFLVEDEDELPEDGLRGLELPEIVVPTMPEREELAAFASMPLVKHATALLEWIGDGKPVTSTGVLRLADIQAAAACVGVAARGTKQRPAADEPVLPGLESLESQSTDAPMLSVRSMHEVPLLSAIWKAMVDAGILDVRSTKVVPYAGHSLTEDATDSARLQVYRTLATGMMRAWQSSIQSLMMLGPALWTMLQPVLVLGCSKTPVPVEALEPDTESAANDEEFMARALAHSVLGRFRQLEGLGLLSLDTDIRVPRHVIRSVSMVCAGDPWETYSEVEIRDRDRGTITMRKPRTPTKAASVFQLKIMLEGSKPPVWRRVLIAADTTLDEVHYVIAAAFDWDNSHLHLFQKPGRNGTTYSCEPVESGPWEDEHVDECEVQLSAVLRKEGDKLDYTYDFGDNWKHRMTLEKILDPETAQKLPSCVDGRGMAPAEDSGGLWGWENLVEAVNSPEHPEHADYRDWLGLEDGVLLDPKAFDKDAVNKQLAKF